MSMARGAKRPLKASPPKGGPAAVTALPMELRLGGRFTDEAGTWEVVGRSSSQSGGKEVKVEVQRPGQARDVARAVVAGVPAGYGRPRRGLIPLMSRPATC